MTETTTTSTALLLAAANTLEALPTQYAQELAAQLKEAAGAQAAAAATWSGLAAAA